MAEKTRIYVRHTKRIDPQTKRFAQAIREANEWKIKRGLPVAKYDAVTNTAYMEYPDGRRVYAQMP